MGKDNSGDRNSGSWNSGDRNSGSWNSGNRNSGSCNSGSWNSTDQESGFFNSVKSEYVNVFNKPCKRSVWEEADKPNLLYFGLTEWVASSEMTELEKTEHPEREMTGGFLKVYDYKEAFQKSYSEASDKDKAKLLKLPNFDADVFFEISGIDVCRNPNQEELESVRKEMEILAARLKELESK